MDDAHLERIMLQLTVADTVQIRQAEAQLKQFLKQPSCIEPLFRQLQRSERIHVRQLAAVLMRKKINTHWPKLGPDAQQAIKQILLNTMTHEPVQLVQKAAAGLIAKIAEHLVPAGQWNELLQFIHQLTQSPDQNHRCGAMALLGQLTQTIGDHLQPHFSSLKGLFVAGLQDPGANVRTASLKAAGNLVEYLSSEEEVVEFRDLVVPMIAVLKQCIEAGDEDVICETFEVFGELAQTHLPILTPSIPILMQFLLEVALKEGLDVGTQDAALYVVSSIIQHKPKTVCKTGLIPALLGALFRICTETPPGSAGSILGDMEDEDDDEETPFRMAQSCLDAMSLHLTKKHIFRPALEISLQSMQSENPAQRRTGVMALGVISEGCHEPLEQHLTELLPVVYKMAQDVDPGVREAACFCLGQFSEHLQPEILDHHSTILPIVFQLLSDGTKQVQGTSCYVLECFCQHLQSESVLPYLKDLIEQLVSLLQTGRKQVQEMAIAALANIAVAADSEFVPYFDSVMSMMKLPLQSNEEEMLSLRGRALECVGHIAIAVGRERFQPQLIECMHYAVQGLQLEESELAEFTYAFFCNVAKVFEQDFTPFLEQLVPHLLEASNTSDGDIFGEIDGLDGDDPFNSDDDESDLEGRGRITVNVRTALLDAKAGAIEALGSLAEATGAQFMGFLPKTMETLEAQAQYFHPSVRCNVAVALPFLALAAHAANPPPGGEWQKGVPVPLPPVTATTCSSAMQMLLEIMEKDDEKEVVARSCESVQKMVETIGPAAIEPHMDRLSKCVLALLRQDSECQRMEEEEEDVDEEDHDHILMDSVADLVGVMAKAWGPSFSPVFHQFLPAILAFAKGSRPATDRSMAIGALAEVCDEIGEATAAFVEPLQSLLLKGLADDNSNVRRNASFCVGVLCSNGLPTAQQYYLSFLQALRPLLEPGQDSAVVDNACAAVARMIMASPESVPLDQVLPVFLASLPMKSDFTENSTAFRCLLGLVQQRNPIIQQNMLQVVLVCSKASKDDYELDEEVQIQIDQVMGGLFREFAAQLAPLCNQLEAEHQAVVRRWT